MFGLFKKKPKPPMLFCIDCKHYRSGDRDTATCERESEGELCDYNLVTGVSHYEKISYREARTFQGGCGEEGKLWESKNA